MSWPKTPEQHGHAKLGDDGRRGEGVSEDDVFMNVTRGICNDSV